MDTEVYSNPVYKNQVSYLTLFRALPANMFLFKVNNRNTKKRCEICSELTIKTPQRRE